MYEKRNRRNDTLPTNIWFGTKGRKLNSGESICKNCHGHGGFDNSGATKNLIRRCDVCEGKGFLDWVQKAKGVSEKEYTHFSSHPKDDISILVKKGKEEEYKKMILEELTGLFKLKSK